MLLTALAAPTLSQPAPKPLPVAAIATPATALARIVMPFETFVTVEVRSARANYLKFADASADLRRMERDFPGARQYIWKALEREWRRGSKDAYSDLIDEMTRVYADGLNSSEIAAATGFYLTPSGQRALQTYYDGADYTAAAEETVTARAVTAEGQAAAYLPSAAKVAQGMTPADQAALSAFYKAVDPAKLLRVFRALQTSVRERANDMSSARSTRLNAVSYQASKEWVTKARSKR